MAIRADSQWKSVMREAGMSWACPDQTATDMQHDVGGGEPGYPEAPQEVGVVDPCSIGTLVGERCRLEPSQGKRRYVRLLGGRGMAGLDADAPLREVGAGRDDVGKTGKRSLDGADAAAAVHVLDGERRNVAGGWPGIPRGDIASCLGIERQGFSHTRLLRR